MFFNFVENKYVEKLSFECYIDENNETMLGTMFNNDFAEFEKLFNQLGEDKFEKHIVELTRWKQGVMLNKLENI